MGTNKDGTFSAEFVDELDELLRWRRDVRRFRPDPLADGVLDEILASAELSPSVGNSQPWRWVQVVSDAPRAAVKANFERCNAEALDGYRGEKAKMYTGLKLAGLDDAPVHLAVFCVPEPDQGAGLGRRTMPQTLEYSVVTAISTLWLAARARGVGVGWVSIVEPDAVARALDVPGDWILVGYLCVGYPETLEQTPELERLGWQARTSPEVRYEVR
ncbi:cob(II)yrinic acid a,c-diamide reductase [Gordonia malaquae]|uniref:Putative oxidoreductase n=1 Tax=Gordonia malaquae NBRC 108250 TaxID=1223542 RepID=M3USV6_GORML|nr:5,6-dimethylbenzimidazole synthase [Gordonia malaquae]GAC78362.1 putative oxidoreductase [Gordonia malaquae NBRC 108250]SED33520.1 cob(II)yrinic acid a,c-diamide reductase [Gordonia malaquae]